MVRQYVWILNLATAVYCYSWIQPPIVSECNLVSLQYNLVYQLLVKESSSGN